MVLSDDSKQLSNIGLEGRPWGIGVVPNKEEAIVTLPNEKFKLALNGWFNGTIFALCL
jgi:hypothetical protein